MEIDIKKNIKKGINEIDSLLKLSDMDKNININAINFDHNRIIYGAPGTGKSYKLKMDTATISEEYVRRVTFHPAYSYTQFVGTYKPVSDNDNSIVYKYVAGPFLQTILDAIKDPSHVYVLIIEEINRADVSAVFGDTFQLLDRDVDGNSEYKITVSHELAKFAKCHNVYLENNKLWLPANMYIWATMNSADQGVMPLDTAFKRRWDFEYINVDYGAESLSKYIYTIKLTNGSKTIIQENVSWNAIRTEINRRLQSANVNEDKMLGAYFISQSTLEKAIKDPSVFVKAFKNKVLMYLFEDAAKYEPNAVFRNEYTSLSKLFADFDTKGMKMFGYTPPNDSDGQVNE